MRNLFLQTAAVLIGLLTITACGIKFAPLWQPVEKHPDFAGALIGASGTIFAGWLAWIAVQYQRRAALVDQEKLQKQRTWP